MLTTDKSACLLVADLLCQHGIEDVVVCPGSRNTPLIIALNRKDRLRKHVVIDERTAAFFALGLSLISAKPVAVVCTSGSAVLNMAPAVAEAYYRRVPLVVISADRPLEWIDQDDSQTIRQYEVLDNIVKGSYDIPVENGTYPQHWFINRIFNDSLLKAKSSPAGPVHVNIQLDMPLNRVRDIQLPKERKINVLSPERRLSAEKAHDLCKQLMTTPRVLIIVGFLSPNRLIDEALERLGKLENVVVMHEAQANISGSDNYIANIDSVLSIMGNDEKRELAPDIVITIGGSLVSRFVKKWLREIVAAGFPLQHWHVGTQPYSVDCFMGLAVRIEMEADAFLSQIADEQIAFDFKCSSQYSSHWNRIKQDALSRNTVYQRESPWSDYKAMNLVFERIPADCNVQLSNGTVVRYAQLFDYRHIKRIDCNRGVSGIDGSTSTAIGAAMAYTGTTILVTGDMSAQYDMGALALQNVPARFKMIVLNNSGGGIFRFVDSTAEIEELNDYYCTPVRLPLSDLAKGFGFAYYEASSTEGFDQAFNEFLNEKEKPAILNLVTPPQLSAQVLKNYFKRQ